MYRLEQARGTAADQRHAKCVADPQSYAGVAEHRIRTGLAQLRRFDVTDVDPTVVDDLHLIYPHGTHPDLTGKALASYDSIAECYRRTFRMYLDHVRKFVTKLLIAGAAARNVWMTKTASALSKGRNQSAFGDAPGTAAVDRLQRHF
ncbi:hypothetical protein [Burkholderia sp. BE17]|uniref:hypothetical protein n=1 Tax=Burkholderia sp. BE17 TaxID=2656644 RepID=UPI001D10B4E3|nr:hypothetical protein [Burkholderia sp. BE17]